MNACFVGVFVFLQFYLSLEKAKLLCECLWLNKWGGKEKEIAFVNWMIKVGEKKFWASSNNIYLNPLKHGLQFCFPLPSCCHKPSQPLSHLTTFAIFPQFSPFHVNVAALGVVWFLTVYSPTQVLWSQSTRGEDHGYLVQAPFLKMDLSFPKPPFRVAFSSFSGLPFLLVGRFLV